jgi:RNA polymerase sigma-70 factor (ECF subfamily)
MDGDLAGEMVSLMPKVRAYARSMTHSSVDAEDLAQETLLSAWRARDRFLPGSNLKAWMFQILRNAFRAKLRRADVLRRKAHRMYSPLVSEADQQWRVEVKEVLGAVAELPPTLREAVVLVGVTGLSYDEAADRCGCSVPAIRGRLNRARERLEQDGWSDDDIARRIRPN